MPEAGPLLNNPAVTAGGIGGVLAILLIFVLWRMLVRIDDSIHEFNRGQHEAADKISRSVADAIGQFHDDKVDMIRAMDHVLGKLDMLLDRTSRTFEQVAFHRGVSEPPLTGQSPAVITPIREQSRGGTST